MIFVKCLAERGRATFQGIAKLWVRLSSPSIREGVLASEGCVVCCAVCCAASCCHGQLSMDFHANSFVQIASDVWPLIWLKGLVTETIAGQIGMTA